jgi:hypothetical protein
VHDTSGAERQTLAAYSCGGSAGLDAQVSMS